MKATTQTIIYVTINPVKVITCVSTVCQKSMETFKIDSFKNSNTSC